MPTGVSAALIVVTLIPERWQADEKRITIREIESPMIWCSEPPGVMEQESEYFALLNNASIYVMNGEDMALSDFTGKNGLVFSRSFSDTF